MAPVFGRIDSFFLAQTKQTDLKSQVAVLLCSNCVKEVIQAVKMNFEFSLSVGRTITNSNHRWTKSSRTKVSEPFFFFLKPTRELPLTDGSALASAGMLKSFQDFLRSEFSDENVEFWLACEDFRASGSADADLRRNAESIYEKFIQPAACREVSVGAQGGGSMCQPLPLLLLSPFHLEHLELVVDVPVNDVKSKFPFNAAPPKTSFTFIYS